MQRVNIKNQHIHHNLFHILKFLVSAVTLRHPYFRRNLVGSRLSLENVEGGNDLLENTFFK